MIRKRMIANGKVQGVYFRVYTKKHSEKLGLTGIVKNLPDGTVYIEAQGATEKVNALIEIVKNGPSPKSNVNHLDIEEIPLIEEEATFEITS